MDTLAALQRLGGGYLMDELHEALVKTAEEVVATGKPGTITLTLNVSTKSQGNPMITVDEKVSRSAPKKDPRGAFFFAVDGGLFKEDPRQAKMAFRLVNEDTGEIKNVEYPERVERMVD